MTDTRCTHPDPPVPLPRLGESPAPGEGSRTRSNLPNRLPDQVPDAAAYAALLRLLRAGDVVVLSGAGLSTESGIPDYRGPDGQRRVQLMTISEFRASAANRHRYWARSYVGWPRFAAARPNDGHRVVARLQRAGAVRGIITQNVDRLHQRAGSTGVVELHGSLSQVSCLQCGQGVTRAELDEELEVLNPGFRDVGFGAIQPDGDVAVPDDLIGSFHGPRCPGCDSDMLKPQVVFFGDTVPAPVVQECYRLVDQARGLLVLGSSLQVMSGLRFVRRASTAGIPVAIVTLGPSRGDPLADIRLDAPLGVTLSALATDLALPPMSV